MKISELQKEAWETAEEKGFHEARDDDPIAALALVHSEVSEALESLRKSDSELAVTLRVIAEGKDEETAKTLRKAADKIEPDPLGEELADIAIRIADLAECEEIDLQEEVRMKTEENKKRPELHGGKNF